MNNTFGDTIMSLDFLGGSSINDRNTEDKSSKDVNRVKRLNDFIKKQSNTLTFKE